MTWKEFKEEVEKKMKEKDISEDENIWYIDISFPEKGRLHVGRNENSGVVITE